MVDHENRKTLDCQKGNLRILSRTNNALNRDGAVNYIYYHAQKGLFLSYTGPPSPQTYVGQFHTRADAEAAQERARGVDHTN